MSQSMSLNSQNRKEPTFRSVVTRVTLIHTVTYFVIGLLSFLLLDYSARYADPAVAVALRQTDHPLVTAGPLFQVLREFLFGIAFYALRDFIFSKKRGWLTLWLVLLIVGIFSPFSSAPGSIEGIVYSTLPMWFHLLSLPELINQSFLLAFLTRYWARHPGKRWLDISLGILFTIIILLALLGVAALTPGKKFSWCGQYPAKMSYVFLPKSKLNGCFICPSITLPKKSSK